MTAAVFPCLPNALEPYRVGVSFSTDIITSYQDYEQRIQLRRIPRRSERFVARGLPPRDSTRTRDMARLDALAIGGQIQQWVLPYWPHGVQITNAVGPGASVLDCDTTDRDFVNGGLAVLWSDSGTFESATITSLSSGTIGATLAGTWDSGTYVFPGRLARWGADPATRRIMQAGADATVAFDLEGLTDPGVATPASPVVFAAAFPDRFRQEPTDQLVRSVARFDSPTGEFADYARGPIPIGRHSLALWLASLADVNLLLTWYYGQKGALAPVWLPTYQADFEPVADIGAGDTAITIIAQNYTAWSFPTGARSHLACFPPGGSPIHRQVIASVDNGDGTETLTLDAAVGAAIPREGGLISQLLYVRLARDLFEIQWTAPSLAEATLDVLEPRETPPGPPPQSAPAPGGVALPPPPPTATLAPVANANGPYAAVAGDTVQFDSTGSHDLYGPVAIAWNFGSGYSPTSSHLYAVAGDFTALLRVTSLTTGLSTVASAAVHIAASGPVVVDHVTITGPANGQTGSFGTYNAVAYDASGHALSGQTFTWTSSNHTVAADPAAGASTAASWFAAGATNIKATVSAVDSNTIAVTVVAPPVLTGLTPNLPAGYTIPTGYAIDMSAMPDGVYSQIYGAVSIRDASSYSPGGGVAAPGNPPASPPEIGEILFPTTLAQGTAPLVVFSENFTSRGWKGLYLASYLQYSSNFYNHPVGSKTLIGNIHGNPCLVVNVTGAGLGTMQWCILLQNLGIGANGIAASAVNFYSGRAVTRGFWQLVQVQAVGNTPGITDGIVRLWVSNFDAAGRLVSGPTKVIECLNVGWAAPGQSNIWNSASLNPVYGGNSPGAKVPSTQYLWCDHLIVGGKT